jgi:hypothetical protein
MDTFYKPSAQVDEIIAILTEENVSEDVIFYYIKLMALNTKRQQIILK